MRLARFVPLLPVVAVAALAALAVVRAWTSDDALITFRIVEQLLGGHGPVLNIGERVQVFTHPLWLMLLTAIAVPGIPLFPGAMWISAGVFALGAGTLFFAFRDKPVSIAVVATMLFLSHAVVDFATSGLETPLTFALFGAVILALRARHDTAALVFLALLPLNRLDLLPWAAPLAALALPNRPGRAVAAVAAVCAPAFLWMVFSTIYFGDPLPNTAHAKLAGPAADRLGAGLGYVVASLASDAGSLALLASALGVAAFRLRGIGGSRDRGIAWAALASAMVGIAYPIWSGGDFMLGRFVLPALWACALLLLALFPEPSETRADLRTAAWCLAGVGVLLITTGDSTTTLWLDVDPDSPARTWEAVGAVDERREYVASYGAFAQHRVPPQTAPVQSDPRFVFALGLPAYFGDHRQRLVDMFGLADPMLARIGPLANSRPGHGYRPHPRTLWRWRDEGHSFDDAMLDSVAGDLRLAHLSEDLWSLARGHAILRLARLPHMAQTALAIADDGAIVRIAITPSRMFRHFDGADGYFVWLRQYREQDLGFGVRLPVAIDAHCAPYAVSGEIGDFPAIAVADGETLSLRCEKAMIGDRPIVLRVGARDISGVMHYDEPIPVYRPSLWWLGAVPKWLTHGWGERPRAAACEGILILALALAIGLRARRSP